MELLDGTLGTSQNLNFGVLLSYDQDRLLAPFVRDVGNYTAKECFRKYTDWHVGIISHLTDEQLQQLIW